MGGGGAFRGSGRLGVRTFGVGALALWLVGCGGQLPGMLGGEVGGKEEEGGESWVGEVPSEFIRTAASTAKTFTARDTPQGIPDAQAAGIKSRIAIDAPGTVSELEVSVDIRHTYIGDLVVSLLAPDGTSVALHNRQGGGTDNLVRTYPVAAMSGKSMAGTWTLSVSDRERADVGRLEAFSLRIATKEDNASAWAKPTCTQVVGTWAVTFTQNDGATVAPGMGQLSGVAYTYGLVALDAPNTLLAEHRGRLLRSTDAGCSWLDIGASPATTTRLVAAAGERAYGWEVGGRTLYRVDGTTVTRLAMPAERLCGLGVDPANPARLRVGACTGQLFESTDSGASFREVGTRPSCGCEYVVAFDPNNLDHVLCGTSQKGTFVSWNGGAEWLASEGDGVYANVFSAVVSPQSPDVVWIEGYQLGWHEGQQIGPEGRRIWRSTDGGRTFSAVLLSEESSARLVNGNLLAAHPTRPELLYFTFGTPPQSGGSRSYLYRLDASTKKVTEQFRDGLDGFTALAFSPADPSVIYLGVSSERP